MIEAPADVPVEMAAKGTFERDEAAVEPPRLMVTSLLPRYRLGRADVAAV